MKSRSFIIFVLLAAIVFGGLALYGDLPDLLDQVVSFPASYWAAALGLTLANYMLRLVRWNYFLKLLGIKVGFRNSTIIFVSGLSMALSPGRVGELGKSYYLKEKLGVPVALSSAAVITERITDVIAVVLLSSWGLLLIPYGWTVMPLILGSTALGIAFLVMPWGNDLLLRLPLPERVRPFIVRSKSAFQQVLSPKPLVAAVGLSLLAWASEGIAFWLVLEGLDTTVSLGQAISVYAAATLLGAITLLPGGLVGTEGGMVALLQQLDINNTVASTATIIIRVCTLWFGVGLGILALAYLQLFMPKAWSGQAGCTTTSQPAITAEEGNIYGR